MAESYFFNIVGERRLRCLRTLKIGVSANISHFERQFSQPLAKRAAETVVGIAERAADENAHALHAHSNAVAGNRKRVALDVESHLVGRIHPRHLATLGNAHRQR